MRTPVNHSVASVNQILFIKTNKDLTYSLAATLVKSKSFSVPVARRAHLFKLLDNSSAVLLFPFPSSFKEFIPAQILFGNSLFTHSLDNFSLGRNRSVVCTGKPKGVISCHSVIADENVLQCIVKGMSHMELTRDVWWRNDYCISLFPLLTLCVKIFVFNPSAVNSFLDILGIVLFFKLF